MGQVVIFSKSNCKHCIEAKALLGNLDIPYTEINIENDLHNGMLMSHISKRHTVPQIFFNNHHIGGTNELKMLDTETIKDQATAALREAEPPSFLSKIYTDKDLEKAVIPLAEILEPHIPENLTSLPEYTPVITWYKGMFGFSCNLYDQMIIKPELTALWMSALSSFMAVAGKKIGPHFGTVAVATALKAGCSYCSAHAADLSLKYANETPDHIKVLIDFLTTENVSIDDLPFDDKLKAYINAAAKMTAHEVLTDDIKRIHSAFGTRELQDACINVGAMGGLMGFLNRFNDLIGVEIEASIKGAIDELELGENWNWGTHDTEDKINRYQFSDDERYEEVPATDLPTMLINIRTRVFEQVDQLLKKYEAYPDDQLPTWIASFPDTYSILSVCGLYHASFNTGDIDPETKHLAAYALATESGHAYIAQEEKRIALAVSSDQKSTENKLAHIDRFIRSSNVEEISDLSTDEKLALRLAKCSATFPHIVRGELVQDFANDFTPQQIVELVISLAVIGSAQRWLSIYEPMNEYIAGIKA